MRMTIREARVHQPPECDVRVAHSRGYDRLQSPSEQRITGGGNGDNDGKNGACEHPRSKYGPPASTGMPTGGSRARCSVGDGGWFRRVWPCRSSGVCDFHDLAEVEARLLSFQHRWGHTATPKWKFTRAAFATCSLASPTADPPRRGLADTSPQFRGRALTESQRTSMPPLVLVHGGGGGGDELLVFAVPALVLLVVYLAEAWCNRRAAPARVLAGCGCWQSAGDSPYSCTSCWWNQFVGGRPVCRVR